MPRRATTVRAVLLALACVLFALPTASATGYAPIMPLAPYSLLLDFTTAGERILVAGERGHILYSDDRGDSWSQSRVPTTQMLTAIHFVGEQRGWAVGHDGLILVSDDRGATWRVQRDGLAAQQQANLEQREVAHSELSRLEAALATASETERDELELRLEETRMDLEDAELALAEAVFTAPLMDVWFLDADLGWAVGAFGTFLETRNGGRTWASAASRIHNPDEFHLNAITGDEKGRVFIAGEAGLMYRSLDGGANWETLEPFYEGSWFDVLFNDHASHLLVYGLRGTLYRSADFGASWVLVDNESTATLAGGASDGANVVLVGAVGTLLISTDGGKRFQIEQLEDRLSLAAALFSGDRLLLAGQGGIRVKEGVRRP